MRLAWDTETGERVAVKIVERQSRKRLGAGMDWAARVAAASSSSIARRSTAAASAAAAVRSRSPADERPASEGSASGKGKAVQHKSAPEPELETIRADARAPQHTGSGVDTDATEGPHARGSSTRARFAPSPPRSPNASASGAGGPLADKRKALLWTTDKKVKREIAIMKKCAHDNVVQLREVIDDPQSKKIFMGECAGTCCGARRMLTPPACSTGIHVGR